MARFSRQTQFLLTASISMAIAPMVQAGSISLMGGGDWQSTQAYSAPATGGEQGTGSQLGFGGGMLMNFDFADSPISLETGALYVHHDEAFGGGKLETDEIDIPADFRLWFGRVFSIGAGGYYGFASGNIEETSPGGATEDLPYAGIRSTNDYGFLGSARFQIPLNDTTYFLINGNYLYGMANVNDTGDGTNLRTRDIQTMVGLSFYW